jgi:hypothetical protein
MCARIGCREGTRRIGDFAEVPSSFSTVFCRCRDCGPNVAGQDCRASNGAMVEFTLNLAIALALALVVFVPQVCLSVLEARQTQRYWARYAPTACPHCQTDYGQYCGQDQCISRLVTFEDAKLSSLFVRDMEPFLGEREFVCKECGTLVVYERKQGPPIQLFVARPEDICRPRRCLDFNDVFLLSAHDKCPICGGDHFKLDAD